MSELWIAILNSLEMVSAFCVFMFCCILSNTILGAVIASKTDIFSWKILLRGVLRNIGILVGVDILAAGFAGLSKLLEIYNIAIEYSTDIQNMTVLGIVIVIITLSYKVYGKQAIDKIKSLGDLKDEDIIVIKQNEGSETRGM